MAGLTRPLNKPLIAPPQQGGGGGGSHVLYVDSVYSDYAGAVTTQVLNIPAAAEAGDLLVLCGMRRSAIVSPTTGWVCVVDGPKSTFSQYTDLCYQVYNGTGTTVTYQQTTAGRQACALLVLRSTTGNFDITNHAAQRGSVPSASFVNYTLPSFTNPLTEPALLITALSWPFAITADPDAYTNTPPAGTAGWTKLYQPSTSDQNRMLGVFQYLGAGQENSRIIRQFSATNQNTDGLPLVRMLVRGV